MALSPLLTSKKPIKGPNVAPYITFFASHNRKPMCYFDFMKTLFINHFNLDAQGCPLFFFFFGDKSQQIKHFWKISGSHCLLFFFSPLMSKVNLKY